MELFEEVIVSLTGARLIVLISLFIVSCFYLSSLRPPAPMSVVAASIAEGVGKEAPGKGETRIVDAMRKIRADMPLNGDVRGTQSSSGFVEKLNRNNGVGVPVDKKNGGARADVAGKLAGLYQQAGKADNGRQRSFAAKPNVKSHHRPLTKPHKGKLTVVKTKRRKLAVKKGVKYGRRLDRPAPAFRRVAKRKLKPLPTTVGVSGADLWGVW